MQTMTRIAALKKFLNEGASRAVEATEMMTFWKSLSDEEKAEFSESAAKQLGVELAGAVTA